MVSWAKPIDRAALTEFFAAFDLIGPPVRCVGWVMKRSGNVGLVLMGGAAFAATFAAGMTYFSWKPSHAAEAQTAASAQNCTTRPDGTQSCEPVRRGFAYYLVPSFFHGSSTASSASTPSRTSQSAALTGNSRSFTPAVSPSGITRGGFGTTAQSGSFRRVSAGG